ncbi:hypothetical protein IWZ03DRAFT_97669 [Phyllosticta citriasiana]|uniref:Uncharacterized protein n=1 Tax=Phyllosticta citriasiana TaxID=595635 RepID=A0ABR1KVY8_9PEZI
MGPWETKGILHMNRKVVFFSFLPAGCESAHERIEAQETKRRLRRQSSQTRPKKTTSKLCNTERKQPIQSVYRQNPLTTYLLLLLHRRNLPTSIHTHTLSLSLFSQLPLLPSSIKKLAPRPVQPRPTSSQKKVNGKVSFFFFLFLLKGEKKKERNSGEKKVGKKSKTKPCARTNYPRGLVM